MSHLCVEQLKYRYPNRSELALDGISFTVNKGEFIGIAGSNTAGKTTLCHAICGLVPHFFKGAYGGRVLIDGNEVLTSTLRDITSKVGFVFENPFSQLSGAKFTVADEIAFGLENLGLPREEMHARIQESLHMLGIEHIQRKNPFDLSGGQMQRLAIASVIAMKPEILVLDEPTSQLDPQGAREVFNIVEKLTHKGMTIVMAEQKMEKLAAYSDRILLLHEGKLVQEGDPSTIFSRDDLLELGVEPPIYTAVAKKYGLRKNHSNSFPVTLEELLTFDFELPLEGIFPAPEKQSTSVVQTEELSFSYPDGQKVLDTVSIGLSNEPIAIIGQNGAGKTTLVKLMKALLMPSDGRIVIDSTNTKDTTAAKLAKKVGLIFQNPDDQIFKRTVLEEVMFGPLHSGFSKEEAKKMALLQLEAVGLSNKAEENPYDISLAERKLIGVASILAMDPDIIIFDEPTMGQDYQGKLRLKEIIADLHSKGKLVICILHDMDFVADVFGRTIVMSQGKVLFDGPTQEAFTQQDIIRQSRIELPHRFQIARLLKERRDCISPS
ncbi:ABC transporter ATP-binding protein [Sporosarcina sp. Te-1]|uniref:ABC transporter ATP-binding protein n=1 Tax=Sporosarcina sp. Te-1 TaxID=2818390 RepID=UPI001A9D1B34|nr:ABC transporter ATP-binding protein [Sporosarcina sp. Te-1]QTD41120.1 energy-coupling factor ABC transporter ATP-binding protein [Sporosarcina sp. Te-1]